MDPIEAFNAMMDDFALGMFDDATEHANDLAEWLNKGGFPPVLRISTDGVKVFTVSDQLSREICHVVCRFVLDQPETGCNLQP